MEKNLRQAVPFFMVINMEASLRFYVERLGFTMTMNWTPNNKIEWCLLERDGVALMLQEYRDATQFINAPGARGKGVSICFICEDALTLYHEFIKKGLTPAEPFVGNNMWVTSLKDPDAYELNFESATDVPEETIYSEWISNSKTSP